MGQLAIPRDRFLLLRGRSLSAEFVLIAETQFRLPMASADDFAFNLLYELGFCMSQNLCKSFKQRWNPTLNQFPLLSINHPLKAIPFCLQA